MDSTAASSPEFLLLQKRVVFFNYSHPMILLKPVLGIRDILVRIRIHGSRTSD
jgi:hypothetical protein